MKKVFLFGGGKILKGLVELIVSSPLFEIIGLHPREVDGIDINEFKDLYNIELYPSSNINSDQYYSFLKVLDIDLIISCNEKQIFKKPIINLAKIAALNLHGGLLPLQRGGGSTYSAFINNQDVGLTIHYLDEGIDSGDIVNQISRSILPTENALDISNWFFNTAPSLYFESMKSVISGKIKLKTQKSCKYSYIPAKPDFDELVNWDENAELIHNKVRGRQGPVYNFTYVNDKKIFILETELVYDEVINYIGSNGQVIQKDKRGIVVKCSDNAILIKLMRYENSDIPFIPQFSISTSLGINLYKEILSLKEEIGLLKNKQRDSYKKFLKVNDKITLKQLDEKSIDDIYEYATNPEFTKYLSFSSKCSKEDILNFVCSLNRQIEKNERFYWGIEFDSKVIGTVGYLNFKNNFKKAELGFGLSPSYWRKGIMSQVLIFLIHYAFNQIKIEKLKIGTSSKNKKVMLLSEKLFFNYEYKTSNHIYYYMTKKDYEKNYKY